VQKFDVCPQDQFLMSSRRRRSRSASGTNPEIPDRHVRLRIRLDFLNRATLLEDVNLPGWKLHSLKGQRKGEYAITVTGNYRLTFRDRKSTRLNSSHRTISYAVFCLKKKKAGLDPRLLLVMT